MENSESILNYKENYPQRQSIEEKFLDLMGFWETYKENCHKPLVKCRSTQQKLRSLKTDSSIPQDKSCPHLIYPKKLQIKRKSSVLITGELLEKFEKCKTDLKNDIKSKKDCPTLRELNANQLSRPRPRKITSVKLVS